MMSKRASATVAIPSRRKMLLTPDNCVVAIIDLQPQMLFGVANFEVYRSAK